MTTFQYFSIFLGEETYFEDEGNGKFTLRILHRQSEPHDIYPERYTPSTFVGLTKGFA